MSYCALLIMWVDGWVDGWEEKMGGLNGMLESMGSMGGWDVTSIHSRREAFH